MTNKCFDCKNIISYYISGNSIYYSCKGETKTSESIEPKGKYCFVKKE